MNPQRVAMLFLCCAATSALPEPTLAALALQPPAPDATPAIPRSQAELIASLAAAERRAADAASTLRERELAVDRAIDLRRLLIAQASDDAPELAGWLIDQGAALLARLARDGSDTAVLFGLPLPAQHQSAAATASDAAALLRRAQELLPVQRETEHDRSVRIPFYLSRAELLLAAASRGESSRRHADSAHALVGRIVFAEPSPEAARRVVVGAAHVLRGDAPTELQIAVDELAWVLTREGREAAAITPLTRAEAWMALLHATAALDRAEALLASLHDALLRPPFVAAGTADPLLVVLATDAATRSLFEAGLRTRSPGLLELAVDQQARLLARTDLPMRADTLRPLIFEKLAMLAELAGTVPDGLELPAAVLTARAVILARDPAARDEALSMLYQVCDSHPQNPFAPDALWELAVLLTQPPHADTEGRLHAAQALTRLADHHPQSPRAAEAMSAALAYARALVVQADHADPSSNLHGPEPLARDVYRRALAVATQRYPRLPDIDLWRYEHARLLFEEFERRASAGAVTVQLLQESLASLRLVDAGSAIAQDAARMAERTHLAHLEALRNALRIARRADGNITLLASDELMPAAQAAANWATANRSPLASRFRLDLAEAVLESGGPGAAATARHTLEDLMPRLDEPELRYLLPRARLVLARAHIAAGDDAAAFALLRSAAMDLEPGIVADPPPSPDVHDTFWHAWTLMAEILGRSHDDRARLLLHIRRLRTIDPDLGGSPWRQRIEASVRD